MEQTVRSARSRPLELPRMIVTEPAPMARVDRVAGGADREVVVPVIVEVAGGQALPEAPEGNGRRRRDPQRAGGDRGIERRAHGRRARARALHGLAGRRARSRRSPPRFRSACARPGRRGVGVRRADRKIVEPIAVEVADGERFAKASAGQAGARALDRRENRRPGHLELIGAPEHVDPTGAVAGFREPLDLVG